MAMDRSNSSSGSSSSSSSAAVLSIECIKGGSKGGEWTGDMLQTGDIVEELKIGIGNIVRTIRAPFKNGKAGVHKILHESFKSKQTSIIVRVRRRGGVAGSPNHHVAELQACIVPYEFGGAKMKKHYMLRSIDDPNYAVGFSDRKEDECLELQATRMSRLVNALASTALEDGYVSYPWHRKMHECLSVANSSSFYSILLIPKASEKVAHHGYNDVEDTVARANAWLNASQESGVPIVFVNIQTESLLTKISGETASSTVNAGGGSLSDLSHVAANTSLYGFEDYHGVDIGVVRAVRLWFCPPGGGEIPIEIVINENDTKLGFAISRTEEGFIYISSVLEGGGDDDVPSTRSGLTKLFNDSRKEGKLLVVGRVFNQKVVPWMVSATGAIRCFDTVSLSQKLSLHRHAKVPILLHLFLWDRSSSAGNMIKPRSAVSPTLLPVGDSLLMQHQRPNENQVFPLPPENGEGREIRLERDTAGELSFRFHDFSFPNNNWL